MRVWQTLCNVDHRLLLSMQQSGGWLSLHSRTISRTADGHLYLVSAAFLYLFTQSGAALAGVLTLAFLLERTLYWLLKNSLRRKRPADAMPHFQSRIIASDEFSFPSGHTSAAFLFATVMSLHFGPVALALYLWAAAVGSSRVFLGVHFPTDTVIGALLGTTIAFVAWI